MQPVKFYDGNVVRVPRSGEYVDAASRPGQRSGRWVAPPGTGSVDVTPVRDTLYFVPVLIHRRRMPAQIGAFAVGSGLPGTIFRFGLFADNDGSPTTLLSQGTVSVGATSGTKALDLTEALDPGMYWLGMVMQGAADGVIVRGASGSNPLVNALSPASGPAGYQYGGSITGSLFSIRVNQVTQATEVPAVMLKL